MKTQQMKAQQMFLAHSTIYVSESLKTNLLPETTVSQSQPTLYLFKLAILTVE